LSVYKRTGFQMKRLGYLLILLMITAQVEDAWAVGLVSPSAPLADDDEYLPSQRRRQEEEESSARRTQDVVGLESQTAAFPLVRKGVPPKWNLTAPFTPPPLYVFMSLQI
jgi:hypothetical protein